MSEDFVGDGESKPTSDDTKAQNPMRERRLHLRAFDYWESLRGERQFPRFEDLKSEDLDAFKDNCLLLDVSHDRGGIIRFVGARIDELIDAPVMVGVSLSAFPHASFAAALVDQLTDEQEHYRAVEFEFVEDVTDSRGILLPFTRDGDGQDHVHFVMVVANFRTRIPDVIMPVEGDIEPLNDGSRSMVSEPASALEKSLMQTQSVADEVIHPNGGTREGLYRALEHAYQLFQKTKAAPETYADILKSEGLKSQKRAPFTPLLKLVFGKTYDKTRLTEYSTALAYAERCGVPETGIAEFLLQQKGGIKGCVKAERAARRSEAGTPAFDRQSKAVAALARHKSLAEVTVEGVPDQGDFALLLARKNDKGALEILGLADVSDQTMDAIVRRMAARPDSNKELGTESNTESSTD